MATHLCKSLTVSVRSSGSSRKCNPPTFFHHSSTRCMSSCSYLLASISCFCSVRLGRCAWAEWDCCMTRLRATHTLGALG